MSKQFVKKLTLLMLVIVSAFTLAACGLDGNRVGGITDDAYLEVGDHKITNRDLYDSFRLDAQSTVKEWFDETLVASQLDDVDEVIATYTGAAYQSGVTIKKDSDDFKVVEWLETSAANAVYGATSYETLEAMSNNAKKIKVETFVDSLSIVDRDLDASTLSSKLLDCLEAWIAQGEVNEDDDWREFNFPKPVLDQYRLTAAQKLKARQQFIEEDFEDEENDLYIKESDIVSYYKNNMKGRYDVEAFYVRFANSNEANAALRYYNLKSTSRGDWVVIPDARYLTDADYATGQYAHVEQILADLNITLKDEAPDRKRLSEAEYQKYYDKYSISTSRNQVDGKKDVVLTDEAVLDFFFDLQEAITGKPVDDADKKVTYTYEDLADNTSLRSHIYTTLVVPEDADDSSKCYSARVQTFGDYCYLVYKYSDGAADEEDIIIEEENEDGDTEEVFNDTDAAQNLRKEALDELKESKFTDTYVNTVVSELYEDQYPIIYDSTIKVFFEHTYADIELGNGGNNDNTIVAEFNDNFLTAKELFDLMEKERGMSSALDLAFTELLRGVYSSEITEDDHNEFKEQYKSVISNFSQNQLESSGYPSSMGRNNFLLVAFGATNNDEALDNAYVIPKLKELYYADLEAHYGAGIYEKFARLAALQYDNYKSVTTSHLLVYVDFDADGSPDDPADLEDATVNELIPLIIELVQLVYNKLGNYADRETAFTSIISEYDSVNRAPIRTEANDLIEGNAEAEKTWKKYRQAGLVLKYESLSAITNTTNLPAAQQYDQVYYDRTMDLFQTLDEFRDKTGSVPGNVGIFPYLNGYNSINSAAAGIDENLVKSVQSSFGWHFISVTALAEATSAKYAMKDDDMDDPEYISEFENKFEMPLTAYNNSDRLTADQIQIYLEETASEYGVQSLPSGVSSAITAFFTPIKTLYDSTNMQRELLIKYVIDQNGGELKSDEAKAQLDNLRRINKLQLFSYNGLDGLEASAEWNALYKDFFNILSETEIVAANIKYVIGDEEPNLLDTVKVYDKDNNEVDVTITKDDSDVDYENAGIYNCVYSATVDGKVLTKTVYIHVASEESYDDKDEDEPTITISDRSEIVITAVSEDGLDAALEALVTEVLSRITDATDDRDGNLLSQVSVNVKYVDLTTPTTSGGYIVIITVSDSSGNEAVESLTVKVN